MIRSGIKKIIIFLLTANARILLWRFKPEIIAITGSAGKTSTKEFLKKILDEDFDVLASQEGYNTDIGAPLSLFEEKVPTNVNNLGGWFVIILRTFLSAITRKDYPQKVIVEMGADKPGDIRELCQVFKPKIGIILAVLPVHLEEFKSVVAVAEEKSELASAIPEEGTLLLNWDDKAVRSMAVKSKGRVIFFGTKNSEGLVAENISSTLGGLSFDLNENGDKEKVAVKIYGEQMIYPLLASIGVARSFGMSFARIKRGLKEVVPFKGRMNIIEGIKDSIIIDDSYNANPESMRRSLDFLGKQKGRRVAVLGNMNELGDYEKEAHLLVGQYVADSSDFLITVGELAGDYISNGAVKNGFPKDKIKKFKTSKEAGAYLAGAVKKGDILLFKGSQNKVLMEQAVSQVIRDKELASKILVRQSEFWQKRA